MAVYERHREELRSMPLNADCLKQHVLREIEEMMKSTHERLLCASDVRKAEEIEVQLQRMRIAVGRIFEIHQQELSGPFIRIRAIGSRASMEALEQDEDILPVLLQAIGECKRAVCLHVAEQFLSKDEHVNLRPELQTEMEIVKKNPQTLEERFMETEVEWIALQLSKNELRFPEPIRAEEGDSFRYLGRRDLD